MARHFGLYWCNRGSLSNWRFHTVGVWPFRSTKSYNSRDDEYPLRVGFGIFGVCFKNENKIGKQTKIMAFLSNRKVKVLTTLLLWNKCVVLHFQTELNCFTWETELQLIFNSTFWRLVVAKTFMNSRNIFFLKWRDNSLWKRMAVWNQKINCNLNI